MGFEAFEHYLSDGSRRGPAPGGAFSGAAGGAPCGDLVRVSLAVERGRVVAASFDAEGCAAANAAGAAVAELVEGASVLDAARIAPAEISAERWRTLAAGSPRRRAGRGRPSPRARCARPRRVRASRIRRRAETGCWWR